MRYRRFLGVLPLFALTACAVGPHYSRPPVASSDHWAAAADTASIDVDWWESLHDPLLTELVKAAVAQNLDLKEADARLREARANRDAVAGQKLPQLDATGSAMRDRVSENGEIPLQRIPGFQRDFWLFDAGFDASWEIDLWGHQSRAVEAATARAAAAVDARHDTVMRVIAEVVRSYVDLRSAQEQKASVLSDAVAQDGIAKLVNDRYRAGEASRFDFVRADAQASATRAAIPGLDADARAAAYRLVLLTGQPPEALQDRLLPTAALPQGPVTVSARMRSDLLRRRPDVRQAERELAAATADVGVATAELFPRLSLVGSVGQEAEHGGDFASASSLPVLGRTESALADLRRRHTPCQHPSRRRPCRCRGRAL